MDSPIVAYARARGFRTETLDRWLSRSERDREALLGLAGGLRMGENQLRDFLDWLEEISLRDGIGFSEILNSQVMAGIRSDPRLSRNDKLNRLKGVLRRLRFPRLARIEDDVQKKIRALKPAPGVQLKVPLDLEGGTVNVELRASSHEELGRLVEELRRLLGESEMKEIFQLLTGDAGI